MPPAPPWRALEWFSGIGGWRAALAERGTVVAAYDIDQAANATYGLTFGHQPLRREIARLPAATLAEHRADTWLLSPPCQPFCRMGTQGDLDDRRSAAFRHLMALFAEAPPERLALENVPGFFGSQAHQLLVDTLRRHAFHWRQLELCPSQFGIPNRRARAFVVAARRPIPATPPPALPPTPLAAFLDAAADPVTVISEGDRIRHWPGLDLVRPHDTRSACFIGGYGQRYVGSGSFLVSGGDGDGGECDDRGDETARSGDRPGNLHLRRFSPGEIARLLGFPPHLRFPDDLPLERRYRLLGNSLAIPVARWVLEALAAADGAQGSSRQLG